MTIINRRARPDDAIALARLRHAFRNTLADDGYITNVFVQPAWRGRGIASQLLDLALAHCREHGAYSVVLWPTDESRALYRRLGFVTPDRLMELACSTTSPAIQKISRARQNG